jgi:hypothetical protein
MRQIIIAIVGFVTYHASAHGGALNYTVGDKWYPGFGCLIFRT